MTSRSLGASRFGSLAALSSLTSLALAATISGFSHSVTQVVAQDTHEATSIVSAATRAIFVLTAGLAVPFALLSSLLPGVSVWAALSLFAVDVTVTGSAEARSSRYIGQHDFRGALTLLAPVAIGRIAAAAVVWGTHVRTIEAATVVALVGGAAGYAISFGAYVRMDRGVERHRPGRHSYRLLGRRGVVYTGGNLIGRASNDIDKVYLSASLGEAPSVGSYAIAYRLAEYASIPMTALSAAAYPRLFRSGASGIDAARSTARSLRGRYLAAGVATSVVIVAVSPLAVIVFGDSYPSLQRYLLALAMLPTVRSVSNNLSEPLTGAGRHGLRVAVWTAGLIVNVAANAVLIPRHGAYGAVIATYATELAQILLFWRLKARLQLRSARGAVEPRADL